MARKTFFSFHYKRDAWRASQVRNSNVVASDDTYGYVDSVDWEQIERQGDAAIERWIADQLKNTSVTVVLIGAETSERDWVDHEIRESWARGNAVLGLKIHGIKDQKQQTDVAGANPLDGIALADGTRLSAVCPTYDWVSQDGRANLGRWIEAAYQARQAYRGETKLEELAAAGASAGRSPTQISDPAKPWG